MDTTKFRVALFPGSFRPWHSGHTAILLDACKAFDQVVVAVLQNPDKKMKRKGRVPKAIVDKLRDKVLVVQYEGMLRDLVKKVKPDAIVRGLRSAADFEYEKISQYWNEDMGVNVPTFFVIAPRHLVHVSSTAIRTIEALTAKTK